VTVFVGAHPQGFRISDTLVRDQDADLRFLSPRPFFFVVYRPTWAALDRPATLIQDGSRMKQMERSGLWLVKVRWTLTGLLKSPDQRPTADKAIPKDTRFIASGRRNESDNYLFLSRTDAESFKKRIEEIMNRSASQKRKAKADIIEVTPEDVAHLDLDPAPRTIPNVKV